MHWITIAITTAALLGLYNFFIKLSAGHIHQIAGAVLLQVVAALLGISCLVYLHLKGTQLETSTKGLLFATLAGISIGIAEILTFYLFSKGISASVGIPILIGGSILVGIVLGLFFLKEALSPLQYLGVFMIIIGAVLLAEKAT